MPRSGQRVGEYVLEQRVGSGTFGEVWRACHHAWPGRFAAVKIPTRAEYVRQLQREGAAVHDLTHPNIVRPLAFDPYADPPYLVMEYVAGCTLRVLLAGRRADPQVAAGFFRQMLRGLAHAHGNGVLHGDVKPDNLLVVGGKPSRWPSGGAVLKLTDFGLSRGLTVAGGRANAKRSIEFSTSLVGSEAARLGGTIAYMAPEQRDGKVAERAGRPVLLRRRPLRDADRKPPVGNRTAEPDRLDGATAIGRGVPPQLCPVGMASGVGPGSARHPG